MSRKKPPKRKITATVTAGVSGPSKSPEVAKIGAAIENAVASKQTVPFAEAEKAVDMALTMGKNIGKIEGGIRLKQALNSCPIYRLLMEVHAEVHRAQKKHRPMAGPHEAYAVILEELDEYWDEVKADRAKQASGRTELIQIAAMAVRALHDTVAAK